MSPASFGHMGGSGFTTFGGTAAANAAAILQREEEEMTPYSPQDLAEDWEFKIIRAATGIFKDPERQRQVLEEEARAGWILVEKFDDSRIRLKRPAAARDRDHLLDVDPYRVWVGMSPTKFGFLIAGLVILGTGIVMGAIAILIHLLD